MKIFPMALCALLSFSVNAQDFSMIENETPHLLGLKVLLNGDCYNKAEIQQEIQNEYYKADIFPSEVFEVAMDVVIQCKKIETGDNSIIGHAVSYNMRFGKFLYREEGHRDYILFDTGGELNIRIAPPTEAGKEYIMSGITNNVSNLLKKYNSANLTTKAF